MRTLGLILAITITVSAVFISGSLGDFLDMPSFLMIACCGLGLYWFGGASVVFLIRSMVTDMSKAEMAEAVISWRRMRESFLSATAIAFVIGLIAIGMHYENPGPLGPALATDLIVVFYGLVVSFVICLPMQRHLEDALF